MIDLRLIIGGLLALNAVPALAQEFSMVPIPAPANTAAIPLKAGKIDRVAGKENWFTIFGQVAVRNVSSATLTPVLPIAGKATGASVIIAPGGGFLMLSMESEGWAVAHWLADHGIAAFVLKYRLRPTSQTMTDFQLELNTMLSAAGQHGANASLATLPEAVVDGQASLALVQRRAAEWGLDPNRVGMMGFSAGAITTLGVMQQATSATMPAFIAPIYGPMNALKVPSAAPAMFNVLASDDPLFAKRGLGLIDAWQSADRPVEFHLYERGGHGFGIGKSGTTSIGWLDAFCHWLETSGFLKPTAVKAKP